jgi:DUF4097 and DUF4098 domain-containing protein YvlB
MLGALAATVLLAAATASAEFTLERRMALPSGGTFKLVSDVGSVVITGDSTSGAQVSLSTSIDDFDKRFDLKFEEGPGTVTVTVKQRGGGPSTWFSDIFRSGRVQFTIHVPRATTVDVDTAGGSIQASALTGRVRVRSSGGGLTVRDVTGNVDGDTSGGPIQVQRIAGDARVNTSGGGITIGEVQGSVNADTSGGGIEITTAKGDIVARTSGGSVRVTGAGGRVEAHSSGGAVSVAFAAGNGKGGTISSSGGGVRAEVDPTVALSIKASSSGGGVKSDIPVTVQGTVSSDTLNGNLNGGGPALSLRSSGGGVHIAGISKGTTNR